VKNYVTGTLRKALHPESVLQAHLTRSLAGRE
jgi:hypothetical protein